MSTVAELMAQKAEIEKKIADAQREDRASAIAQVRSAAGKAVSKVAAKYRDAVTGNTWSGRGLKPNWLKAALDGEKTLADFAV